MAGGDARLPDPRAGPRAGDGRPRPAARRGRARRPGRGRLGHRRDAAGAERARGDRPREGEARGRSSRGCPTGVRVVTAYDRSDLIRRAIGDARRRPSCEVILTISVIILLFLWHVPSAIIPIVTIPLAVLISFVPFGAMGLTANIMSLGGIAIAIGALDDAAIVVVEQTHKKLEQWEKGGRVGDYRARRPAGDHRGRGPELLLAARDRRLLPAGARPRGAGGAALQAARLHQDAGHARGGGARDHARPRAADAAHAPRRTSPSVPRWLRRVANTVLVGRVRQEETPPGQPRP